MSIGGNGVGNWAWHRTRALLHAEHNPHLCMLFLTIWKLTNIPFNKAELRPLFSRHQSFVLHQDCTDDLWQSYLNSTTVWFSFNNVSKRFEPIKPATPVTSHVFGRAWNASIPVDIDFMQYRLLLPKRRYRFRLDSVHISSHTSTWFALPSATNFFHTHCLKLFMEQPTNRSVSPCRFQVFGTG